MLLLRPLVLVLGRGLLWGRGIFVGPHPRQSILVFTCRPFSSWITNSFSRASLGEHRRATRLKEALFAMSAFLWLRKGIEVQAENGQTLPRC
ncbi:hypothetical protein F4821DRAFT_225679 [Hypoxylon rubiginosum]|uniref:Uncharacterized protein n=1 Tax=Hypoxylon rubiginosum TaxID=110542 RepID=A0ACC0DHY8_9PEZI|nr:hypothetical protein F4821DRAFT_225679 [Hypoxylon rubiginosum]